MKLTFRNGSLLDIISPLNSSRGNRATAGILDEFRFPYKIYCWRNQNLLNCGDILRVLITKHQWQHWCGGTNYVDKVTRLEIGQSATKLLSEKNAQRL